MTAPDQQRCPDCGHLAHHGECRQVKSLPNGGLILCHCPGGDDVRTSREPAAVPDGGAGPAGPGAAAGSGLRGLLADVVQGQAALAQQIQDATDRCPGCGGEPHGTFV